ncbi:MAG TPA: D-alanyl-D-alanine carboxypeptidase family protein [Ruminiclostridium sp.]
MTTYIVVPGDSLYFISKKFNATIDILKYLNNLKNDYLDVGQILNIPDIILPYGIYSIGSTGSEVFLIQRALAAIGYNIVPDGVYGRKTSYAIYSLQQKYPEALAADGIYGPKTKLYLELFLNSNYHIIQNPYSILALVNKHNSLPSTYVPQNLVVPNIPFLYLEFLPQKLMRFEAAQALEQLFAKAKKDNISLLGVSGYRSYNAQVNIFGNKIKASSNANQSSARPGESEHQTGLSIDLTSPSINYVLTQSFGETKEGKWLKENAPNYGFIIRFPQGKELITGYQYEPWHIRYVGIPVAKKISQNNLTLEEYLFMH